MTTLSLGQCCKKPLNLVLQRISQREVDAIVYSDLRLRVIEEIRMTAYRSCEATTSATVKEHTRPRHQRNESGSSERHGTALIHTHTPTHTNTPHTHKQPLLRSLPVLRLRLAIRPRHPSTDLHTPHCCRYMLSMYMLFICYDWRDVRTGIFPIHLPLD
jgi:hypothetical protein